MATENKITKRDMFTHIAEAMADDAAVVEFCEKEIASLDAKAVKAKERAEAKRAEGDELCATVASVLTTEPQTREQIFAQVEGEDLSVAKIGARLTQLVKYGKASKVEVSIDGKKRMAYTLPVDAE